MRPYDIVSGTLLVLSTIDFALAAPVLVQEKRQAGVDAAHIPKDVITVLGKRAGNDDFAKLMESLFMGKTEESAGGHASSGSAPPVPDHASSSPASPGPDHASSTSAPPGTDHASSTSAPPGTDHASSSSAPPGPDHGSTNVAQEPEPNPAPSSPTQSVSSVQALPDSQEGHLAHQSGDNLEPMYTPGSSDYGGDHEGDFQWNPNPNQKTSINDDSEWEDWSHLRDPAHAGPSSQTQWEDWSHLKDPAQAGPSSQTEFGQSDLYHDPHPLPGSTEPTAEDWERWQNMPWDDPPSKLTSPGQAHEPLSGEGEFSYSGLTDYHHGGLQDAYRPLHPPPSTATLDWIHDLNLPESFTQAPTESYLYRYPGSEPHQASTDFEPQSSSAEPQSSSADSPSQPEDPEAEAARRYAAKGKAKETRRNSGTARDEGNAAQWES